MEGGKGGLAFVIAAGTGWGRGGKLERESERKGKGKEREEKQKQKIKGQNGGIKESRYLIAHDFVGGAWEGARESSNGIYKNRSGCRDVVVCKGGEHEAVNENLRKIAFGQ